MERSEWFARQLAAGVDLFTWAVGQMPLHLLTAPPPRHPSEWPVARHVFHLAYYERTIALLSMQHRLGGPPPETLGMEEGAVREEQAWLAARETPIDMLRSQLQSVRDEQVQLARARTPRGKSRTPHCGAACRWRGSSPRRFSTPQSTRMTCCGCSSGSVRRSHEMRV